MTKFYLLALCSLLILGGCKTAGKSYEKGDYKDAIELGIRKLLKDPADDESAQIIRNAYSFAVRQHEEQVRSLMNSKSEGRYAAIYNEYLALQDLYRLVTQYPSVSKLVSAVSYAEYVDTYRDKAAEVHISNAQSWEQQQTKTAYREAYNEYKKAIRYRPNDVELKKKRETAFNAAVTKVLVVPIQESYGGYNYRNSYQFQNFQNEVMRTLSFNMGSEFVKFYSEWELRNNNLEPDQVMELNVGRIIVGRPYDNNRSREVSKRVVSKEIVYKPDSIVKEYTTVRARVTSTQRTVVSEGELYITVRDVKGRTIWSDRFTGQHRWQTEFASYTGDERALSESDKASLNRRNDYPPSEDEVLDKLFREINNELSYRLRNYFARY